MIKTNNIMCQATNNIPEDQDEPIFYCMHCLDLKIIEISETKESYCGRCGNTDIMRTSFENWEALYEEEYGRKYLEQTEIPIFNKQ